MTVCVAAMCDDRKAIVLAADKMVGFGAIESEADIHKIVRLHKDWWVMMAANDISPAFDIIDAAKQRMSSRSMGVDAAIQAVVRAYQEKRLNQAEAIHLTPRGWSLIEFNSVQSVNVIPSALRIELDFKIQAHHLSLTLLVAGFDRHGLGHIFSVDDYDHRASARRHDIPGYHAIGSGSQGAMYMMAYREVSSSMPIRGMLYYVAEGKYFGELASGVGERTDLHIIRPGRSRLTITEKAVEDKLVKLCQRLEPKTLDKKGVDVLNSLHGKNMDTVAQLKSRKVGKRLVVT